MKLSVIIPTYRDIYLNNTIQSLLDSSQLGDELEIIPILDGYIEPVLINKRVKPVYLPKNLGMRGAINMGILHSGGEFIMKCDSHCSFKEGYDKILTDSCNENWLMIPRRYSLDEGTFTRNEKKPVRDYQYFSFPVPTNYGYGMFIGEWIDRNIERNNYDIDDTMAFQGSCWMANRKYFLKHLKILDDRRSTYGTFAGDQPEIGLKYWLNGGEVKVNKNVWYAHLFKCRHHYDNGTYHKTFKNNKYTIASHTWAAKHWMDNQEPNMQHPFEWLIDKFWPIPGWKEDWKEIWKSYNL
jgi:glycosyltransferase involved in cell wall biosynthesis